MASFNRVIMMGNLTRDPDYKQLSSGQAVVRLGLASNRQFKNKQTGTMVQEVCFVDVDVWGPQAESCRQYLSKGRAILIEGRLKLDTWQESDGTKRSKHSIVADRVTFVSSGAQAEGGVDMAQDGSSDSVDAEPRADFVPATAAKTTDGDAVVKAKSKKVTAKPSSEEVVGNVAAPSGEINFKDEKPFEDDLPF